MVNIQIFNAHLFVLFPLLILLAIASHRLYRRNPEAVAFYYFRNFFALWSVCTVAHGIVSAFDIQPPLKPLLVSIVVPFYYFAMAYLIRLPFAIYKRLGIIANALSLVIVLVGISIGLSNYFAQVIGNIAASGFLSPLVEYIAANMVGYRITTTVLFMLPVGLFFLYEAMRAMSVNTRISVAIVGFGLIVSAIAESQHIIQKHAVIADFGTAAGFIVVFIGLWLPFLLRPAEAGVPREADRT